MIPIKNIILLIIFIFWIKIGYVQSVGVVLSGGGASGIAHIGFLKALEEHNIPIDYVTGTSMGALVGGLYAAGYSPTEIEQIFTSEKYVKMAQGKLEEDQLYYFKKQKNDAAWVTFKLSKNDLLEKSLPTNLVSPVELDFEIMGNLSGPAAAANYNFDSLFVPFRCVASDVEGKSPVIFDSGHLSEAVRASISYPFYLKPIRVNGKLLFDGGLYNNFPADVMYQDFLPDIIIGSNVSGNAPPPDEDNLFSQLNSMLVNETNYSIPCEDGLIILPNTKGIGLFDFEEAQIAIDSGYVATNKSISDIKKLITKTENPEIRNQKRAIFKNHQAPLNFDKIKIDGLNNAQKQYVISSLRKRNKALSLKSLRPSYFKVFADDKIKYIYPTAKLNKETNLYDLSLIVKKEKDIILNVGGNFSSRPINTGYVAGKYNYLDRISVSLMGNLYFGKFYASTQARARIDFPVTLPFYIEPEFTINRWDYFRSRATFFDDISPSFFLKREQFSGLNAGIPVKNKAVLIAGIASGHTIDEYYQTTAWTKADTADRTDFGFLTSYLSYERNTLNYKQYANKGTYLNISGRIINGNEQHEPGSTSNETRNFSKIRQWYYLKLDYDNYYKQKGAVRLGLSLHGLLSTQPIFNNYTATILRTPAFHPTPESKTLFLESFRAPQYLAFGKKVLFNLTDNIDFRLEGYLFQPYQRLIRQEDESVKWSESFDRRYTLAMAAAVYNSPIGPISFSLNYYHNNPEVAIEDKTPLTFLFHFGYVIFNKKALE